MGMKFVKLLHNPDAGDRDHSVKELAEIIRSAGFQCSYLSTKKVQEAAADSVTADVVALAGGDGTIRKAAKQLLDEGVPIGLFPMGTANNIARTLSIPDDPKEVVSAWTRNRIKPFDIGRITGLDEQTFFLEGFGFGVFPLLMDAMKAEDKKNIDDPEKKIKIALETLSHILALASATYCEVTVDGRDYFGKFLLAEVMNTRSIGPNLALSPDSDPGDGKFEVVLITEEQRDDFIHYINSKIRGNEKKPFFNIIRGREIAMKWDGTAVHIDDEKKTLDQPATVMIELRPAAFHFLVP